MKTYFKKDVVFEMDLQIQAAAELNKKIELFELDIVESDDFLTNDVVPLMKRGILVKEFGIYIYRGIELRLHPAYAS